MYLSQNYLSFHANIFNWKTSLSLKFEDISDITREKTAKIISNAIEIKSNKAEKYFFASFVTRDKTYTLINQLWEAITSNQVTLLAFDSVKTTLMFILVHLATALENSHSRELWQ